MKMSNDIIVRQETFMTPTTEGGIENFLARLHRAGMLPKDCQNIDKAFGVIMHGLSIGMTPMQALKSIANINGRHSVWGDAVLGLVQASGLLEDIDEACEFDRNGEPIAATCIVRRKGRKSPIKQIFTMAMAKKAGLAGKSGPWSQYPARMLQMRARSWALRDAFPDVLMGTHIAEEAQDYPPMKDPEQSQAMRAITQVADDRAPAVSTDAIFVDEQPSNLRQSAEDAAVKGVDAYRVFWESLSGDEKRSIGVTEHSRLKAIAEKVSQGFPVSEETQEHPAPVPSFTAPVPQPEPVASDDPF
ncbi:MAG: recombinase RecT [Magnetococcus sp. THC-1_WYH]